MSKESKFNISSTGRTYGYDKKGGWDIDTSDRTQKTSDSGHIPGRYQWEETVDVSSEDEKDKQHSIGKRYVGYADTQPLFYFFE